MRIVSFVRVAAGCHRTLGLSPRPLDVMVKLGAAATQTGPRNRTVLPRAVFDIGRD